MQVGPYTVTTLEAESFALDGGAMFGIVPKPLWEGRHPADDRNRIRLVTRCLLVRGAGRVVLVDSGMGGEWSEKDRDIFAIGNTEHSIVKSLESIGVGAEEVTDVLLTHLHFDHVGGAVTRHEGELVPTFEHARYHVQERHLAWAMNPTDLDRGSFRPETFLPLREHGRLSTLSGPGEPLEGIFVEPTVGHTVDHQIVRVGEQENAVVYCGDLIPTAAHLPAPWVMGYDLQPLQTMEEKINLLSRAAENGWVLVFEHDPGHAAVRVARDKDAFVVDGPVGMD
jgi:glyoxylase-like metal-dependent hydrolase (beta-lactamase superfamily II)